MGSARGRERAGSRGMGGGTVREMSRGFVLPAHELQSQIVTGFGASLGSFDCMAGAIRVFQAGEGWDRILFLCVPSQY